MMNVQFHRFTNERSFRSANDFARYAEEQADDFALLKNIDANAYDWWAGQLQNNWANAANIARAHPDNTNSIAAQIRANPVFTYKSTLTRTLREMCDGGRADAARQIMPFLKGETESHGAQNFRIGQLTAHSEFQLALKLDRHLKSGKHIPLEEVIADHEERLQSLLRADQKEIEQLREAFAKFSDEAREKHEALDRQMGDFILKSKATWNETYASYVDQLATETAVELWSNRSTKHETRYKSFRSWVIGFGLTGLVLSIAWIFGGFALAKWAFGDDTTAQLASYTAGSLALFTLLVWGLRVLIRSMMSEDHLSTDASARSALAHTYLALTKEEAATPDDRAIILAALFAPVSDGLVKDDGMPAFSPAAIAAQAITNPK